MDASLNCHGISSIEGLGNVAGVVIGFTQKFSYNDILLASYFLNDPHCLFLEDAPDATFNSTSDGGIRFQAPCKD